MLFQVSAQTPISGVINSYGAISNIDNSDVCAPFVEVDNATGFDPGDAVMLIQMQGATIDDSNSNAFGTILNLNSAGLYERNEVLSVSGNTIYLAGKLANPYDVSGSVQIVTIEQYTDAIVTANLEPYFWDGSKGGIIAMEVSGTLTLNADINVNNAGFRGGVREVLPSVCSFASSIEDYYFPDNSELGSSKGEGIANFISGKENGRGAQANGGGGGNDHNSGGGGGSHFGSGGLGGMNLNPTPLQCLGQFPGAGGYAITDTANRLFMGGGGGAGHDNDGNGTDGGNGGGIIYLKANNLIANWNFIVSKGEQVFATPAGDGGGGGGAAGTLFLDVANLDSGSGLLTQVEGGRGGDTNALGSDDCFGGGGGGAGGIIYTDIVSPDFYTQINGGVPGVVINSTSLCNGTSNGGSAGLDGAVFGVPIFIEALPLVNMNLTSSPTNVIVCDNSTATFTVGTDIPADNYQWSIDDGLGYTNLSDGTDVTGANAATLSISNLPIGNYTVQCTLDGGCGDMYTVTATLQIEGSAQTTIDPEDQLVCEDEMITLNVGTLGTGVSYQWEVNDGSGWMPVSDGAVYSGSNTDMLTFPASSGIDGYQYQCVLSNACPGTSTSAPATVTINDLPTVDFTYYFSGDSLIVTSVSTGANNYYWDFGDGTPLYPGLIPYYVYASSGTYNVTLYAYNDCGTVSATYPVNYIATSNENIFGNIDFSMSPNPTSGQLTIDMSSEEFYQAGIHLYDVQGRRLSSHLTEDKVHSFDISSYASGTYLVQVIIEGKTSIQKIIKE